MRRKKKEEEEKEEEEEEKEECLTNIPVGSYFVRVGKRDLLSKSRTAGHHNLHRPILIATLFSHNKVAFQAPGGAAIKYMCAL